MLNALFIVISNSLEIKLNTMVECFNTIFKHFKRTINTYTCVNHTIRIIWIMQVWPFLAKKYHPKNSLNYSLAGITKLKIIFRPTPHPSNKFLWNLYINRNFMLTAWLNIASSHNLKMDKAIMADFFTVPYYFVPRYAFSPLQYLQDLHFNIFVFQFLLLTTQSVNLTK